MADKHSLPEGVDPTVPNVARMYDYALGGKDHFAADRAAVEKLFGMIPVNLPVVNRAFLRRAVRFLAEAGIRQFLDLGSGLPTQGNVHEIAQKVSPDAHVVYVDYDPVAVVHGRALLANTDGVEAIQADVRQPETILTNDRVTALLDFTQPVAVLLAAVLHVVPDDQGPHDLVARYRDIMAPGSHLAISHITSHEQPTHLVDRMKAVFEKAREPMVPRSRDEILQFFDGCELVDPGLVPPAEWRPDETAAEGEPPTGFILAGVAHKA